MLQAISEEDGSGTTQAWNVTERTALILRQNAGEPHGEYIESKEQRDERGKHEHGLLLIHNDEEEAGSG